MSKGKLIVIDGTDGSGKATQVDILCKKFLDEGLACEMMDFPQYGQKSAGMVEEYLNGKYGNADSVTPYQASVLYAVDRFDASFKIRKFLDEGKFVVCNRYTTSNMGHQAGKIADLQERDKFLNWLDNFEYNLFKIPRPDLNIFLYLDPEISRKNALQVTKTNMDKGKDIHENDSEHMKNASLAYKYVADKYGWDTILCGDEYGNFRSKADIERDIWSVVKNRII